MLNLPKRCPTCGRKMVEEEKDFVCDNCGKRIEESHP